jgi:predicted TIM-barrel fold metal-dependent hydrolase
MLAQWRPQNRFVLMHMGWPYQEHMLAVAKHLRNVVVDLCWAWILAPWSTADFVCRFLTTAPSTKLLCFGGDYMTVESIVGHAELARRGLQAALERLVQADWFSADQALAAAPELMRGNAYRVFCRTS